jgi:transglutaminase-like putative cysteine protease
MQCLRNAFWAGFLLIPITIAHTAVSLAGPASPEPASTGTVSPERPPYSRMQRNDCTMRPGDLIDCQLTSETLIGSPVGAQQMPQAQLTVNEHFNQLEIVEAANLKADGRRLDVPADKIVVQANSAEDQTSFDADETAHTIIFPDVAEGDRLRYIARYTAKRPARPGGFNIAYSFEPEYRYSAYTLTLDVPAGLKLQTAIKGFTHRTTEKPGRIVHEWTLEPLPYRAAEPDAVSSLDRGPYIHVTSFPDWRSAAQSFCSGAEPMADATPEIKKLADEITNGQAGRKDQAQAIFDWVASNIRYVNITLGAGGFVPRPANFIAANRYGDCKDHATLMRALLAAKGIDSEYALIDFRPIYKTFSIPLEIFDHVIVHVPELNLYVDPTAKHSVFHSLPSALYDKPVLRCAHGESVVARTPPASADADAVSVDAQVTVNANGKATGKTVTVSKGNEAAALRSIMASVETSGSEQSAKLLAAYYGFSGSGRIEPTPSTDRSEPYAVTTHFTFDDTVLGENYPAAVVTGLRVASRPFEQMAPIFRSGRIADFVCQPFTYREKIAYSLPKGWTPKALPKDVSVSRGPAAYSARYSFHDGAFEAERSFSLRTESSSCPAAMARELAPVFRAASRDVDEQLTFVTADANAADVVETSPPSDQQAQKDERPPYAEIMKTECSVRDRRLIDCTRTSETVIGSRSGAESRAEQRLSVNENFHDLEIVEAANIKANGVRNDVPADKIMTQTQSTGWEAAYEANETIRTIIYPNVEVGDRLRYVIRYRAKKERVPGGFNLTFFEEPNTRVTSSTETLDAPADMPLHIGLKGYTQKVAEADGRRHYEWVKEPKPFRSFEYLSTSALDTEPYLHVSSFADWNAAGQSFCGPARRTSAVTPEIAKLADEITSGQSGHREQSKAIFDWVSTKIKEVNVSLGNGLMLPNPAGQTLHNGYGDSKDIATLMRALLAAKGIDSDYVEINHSSHYKMQPIPMQYFNSVMLYIPEFDLYADPTERYSSFGVLAQQGYDKPVLRCGQDGVVLARAPVASPEANSLEVIADVTVDQDGKPSGVAINTGTGVRAFDLRSFMTSIETKGVEEVAKPTFDGLQTNGAARVLDQKASTDHSEPYAVKLAFSIDDSILGEDNGMEVLTGPVTASPPYSQMAAIFRGVRVSEFTCHPSAYSERAVYRLPAGWTLKDKPKSVSVVAGPAEYSVTYTESPGVVTVDRKFALRPKSHVCPAAMAREMAPAFRAALQDINVRLTFIRTR